MYRYTAPPPHPQPVPVPQGAAGPSGEGLAEELGSGERGCSASAALSGFQPRDEEGNTQMLHHHNPAEK